MDDALLLDTCALLWLASGSERLSAEARDRIRRAPEVYYSPISAWETLPWRGWKASPSDTN